MLCLRNFPEAKTFMDKNGGGISTFSVELFVFPSAKNFRKGTLLYCFRKIPLAETYMDMRGVSIKIFRRKFFVSKCRIICKVTFQCSASVFSCSEKVQG